MENYVFSADYFTNKSDKNESLTDEFSTWQYAGKVIVGKFVFLSIFIFGWINNILAIVVLRTKTYRRTTTGFLLIAVAVADIGSTSTTAAYFWIWYHIGVDIMSLSSIGCKVYAYCSFGSLHVSAWSLTLITIIRTVSVCKPFLVKTLFSLKRTVIIWSCIIGVALSLDLFIFLIMDLRTNGQCNIDVAKYGEGWYLAGWTMHFVLGSAGPFFIMIPCNAVVLTQIMRRHGWHRQHATSGTRNATRLTSTSVMCLANSLAFILLTAPHVIYAFTMYLLGRHENLGTHRSSLQFHIYWALYALNSCVNFLLYSVASRKFRQAFKYIVSKIIGRWWYATRGSSTDERHSSSQSTPNVTPL